MSKSVVTQGAVAAPLPAEVLGKMMFEEGEAERGFGKWGKGDGMRTTNMKSVENTREMRG